MYIHTVSSHVFENCEIIQVIKLPHIFTPKKEDFWADFMIRYYFCFVFYGTSG